jgi:hypothetical protein
MGAQSTGRGEGDPVIVAVVLSGLAGWRLASLLVSEDGPWQVFARIRKAAGVPDAGEVRGLLPEILSCTWCCSIWTSAAMLALWSFAPWLVAVFAAAAVALVAESAARGWRAA